MKNFIQPGDVVSLVTPSDVKSWSIVTVGALTGVFELPKRAGAVVAGDLAYWADGKVVAEGELLLGAIVAAAGADSATCRVRLSGITS